MAEFDNTNRGVLFKNTEKDDEHPNWPDYKGNLNAQGVEFWLSAWIKTDKEDKKYMSLSMVKKEVKGAKKEPAKQLPANYDDSEIPF